MRIKEKIIESKKDDYYTMNTSIPSSSSYLSQQQNPKYNTNNDVYVYINKELKPRLIENFKSHSVVEPGEKCICDACPIWQRSEYALQPNLNIIGNVSSNTSILILQGENYTQTFKNVLVFCYMVFFL